MKISEKKVVEKTKRTHTSAKRGKKKGKFSIHKKGISWLSKTKKMINGKKRKREPFDSPNKSNENSRPRINNINAFERMYRNSRSHKRTESNIKKPLTHIDNQKFRTNKEKILNEITKINTPLTRRLVPIPSC